MGRGSAVVVVVVGSIGVVVGAVVTGKKWALLLKGSTANNEDAESRKGSCIRAQVSPQARRCLTILSS